MSVGMVLGGLGIPIIPSNLIAVFAVMFPGGSIP